MEGCKLRHFGNGIQQEKIRSVSQVEGSWGSFTFFNHMGIKNAEFYADKKFA